ncbi:MAG: PhoP regulatory network protein YrbL [Oxalobacter sp.]|nr:PhoP regulatory network protein YrbL [Oxalobacter sp.]
MIDLSQSTPLGTGAHRSCYLHPDNKNLCIKVLHDVTKSELKGIKNEMRYYNHIQGYLKDWSGIPRFHGTVETNMGIGYVFDLITDFDGTPSVTLEDMLETCDTPEKAQKIIDLILALKKYIRDNHILTITMNPHNVLCRRISETQCVPVICDNLGRSSFLPWSHWFQSIGDNSQQKRWERFIKLPLVVDFLERFNINGRELIA